MKFKIQAQAFLGESFLASLSKTELVLPSMTLSLLGREIVLLDARTEVFLRNELALFMLPNDSRFLLSNFLALVEAVSFR